MRLIAACSLVTPAPEHAWTPWRATGTRSTRSDAPGAAGPVLRARPERGSGGRLRAAFPYLSFFSFVALSFLAASPGAAQTTYVAFGDSITFGFGDDPARAEKGYPPRLETLLQTRGQTADVRNEGLSGETTGEGVTRITRVLQPGDDVLLLMEGTNDVGKVSIETIRANLAEIARKAAAAGVTTVHATVVPRLPSAVNDGQNLLTRQLAAAVRDLAWNAGRDLADPFEVIFRQTPNFPSLYLGGDDKVHPNALGYDLLATIFADVLTDVDKVPPVTGFIQPAFDAQNVAPDTPVRIDLYDFGTGIDLANTQLVVNGTAVETPISGSDRKLEIRYEPPQPFSGVVRVTLRSRDRATPANVLDREVTQFVIAGTVFLKGDIDRDGRVDGADLLAFALVFGAQRGDSRFKGFADLNVDDQVDGLDLALLAANFGKSSV